jgi:hypothetical protein
MDAVAADGDIAAPPPERHDALGPGLAGMGQVGGVVDIAALGHVPLRLARGPEGRACDSA